MSDTPRTSLDGWNYRVVHSVVGEEELFTLHEIYYDENGRITMWSLEPIPAGGQTLAELVDDLEFMRRALENPVLELAELARIRQKPDSPR